MPRGMRVFSHTPHRVTIILLIAALAGCKNATPPKGRIELPQLVTSDATFPELEQAHAQHRSNVWVDGGGTVTRILRDDTKRPRHQRFVVRVGTGPGAFTVMIAHNIDRAPRVPFKKGDDVTFRGEYVWNDQGGVLHWTHDPRGWIRWKDFVYR
jgi:uncharacterized protein DUF3465